MTALPLSASAGAPCDCESSAAPIAPPATLPTDVRAYVASQPDALLVAWLQLSPQALDVLTERERAHALGLIASTGNAAAAAYVRERLTGGDLPAAARRIALENGALVKIDSRAYYVERRTGERTWRLRGPSRGAVDLSAPNSPAVYDRWSAWIGGVAARNARLRTLRRDAAGHFTRVP